MTIIHRRFTLNETFRRFKGRHSTLETVPDLDVPPPAQEDPEVTAGQRPGALFNRRTSRPLTWAPIETINERWQDLAVWFAHWEAHAPCWPSSQNRSLAWTLAKMMWDQTLPKAINMAAVTWPRGIGFDGSTLWREHSTWGAIVPEATLPWEETSHQTWIARERWKKRLTQTPWSFPAWWAWQDALTHLERADPMEWCAWIAGTMEALHRLESRALGMPNLVDMWWRASVAIGLSQSYFTDPGWSDRWVEGQWRTRFTEGFGLTWAVFIESGFDEK